MASLGPRWRAISSQIAVSQALDKQAAIMSNLPEMRMIRGIRRKPPLA